MTIQEALKGCLSKTCYFGRPVGWRGSGEAVDLSRRLDPTRALRVQSFGNGENLMGTDWRVDPTDFLGQWELVTAEELAKEACGS